MRRLALVSLLLDVLLLAACNDTGRAYVDIPLHAVGGPDRLETDDGWSVSITRAELALGPIWLCATESASPEFCDASVLELTDSVRIDALDPEMQLLATMRGVTGTARSVMFDYGISWLPTASRARPTSGAIDGHSARFEARATHTDGRTFELACDLDLLPPMQGAVVIRGQRIEAREIVSSDDALVVRVDATRWLSRLDYERLAARGEARVVLAQGDADYEALVVALTAGALPSFE